MGIKGGGYGSEVPWFWNSKMYIKDYTCMKQTIVQNIIHTLKGDTYELTYKTAICLELKTSKFGYAKL